MPDAPVVTDPDVPDPLPAISGPPPHPSCEPLYPCASLDGQLLINRVLHGPALGYEEAEIPFGTLRLKQLNNFAYFEACVNAVWTPLEACYGPIRSIFGLAPGETVTLHVRDRREESSDTRSFEQQSEGTTTSSRFGTELVSHGFDKELISSSQSSTSASGGIGIGPISIGGGAGTSSSSESYQILVRSITSTVNEFLSSVTNSEVTEAVVQTAEKTQVERGIARTFTNPYRDRSLELRFIPVFRKFRVTWDIRDCSVGVVVTAQQVEFPEQGTVAQYGRFIQDNLIDPRVLSVSGAELMEPGEDAPRTKTSALHDHLRAYPYLYTKRFLRHAAAVGERPLLEAPVRRAIGRTGVASESDLDWRKLRVRENGIYVPFVHRSRGASALGMGAAVQEICRNCDQKQATAMQTTAFGDGWPGGSGGDNTTRPSGYYGTGYGGDGTVSQGDPPIVYHPPSDPPITYDPDGDPPIIYVPPVEPPIIHPPDEPHIPYVDPEGTVTGPVTNNNRTKDVMLFIGTRIEAVPGFCILPDLPSVTGGGESGV